MKSRAARWLGRSVRLGPDGRVGQVFNTASQQRRLMLAVKWADTGLVSWHHADELTVD